MNISLRLSIAAALFLRMISPAWGVSKDGGLTIGLIGKASVNPLTPVVRRGAEQAAFDLGQQYGIKIKIVDATPPTPDARQQVDAIEKLVLDGVDGFAIDCADTAEVGPAIDEAAQAGVLVATFASDAPASKRFFFYSIDNVQCGQTLMVSLAELLKGKGSIAVLSGNPQAQDFKQRVQGIKSAATLYRNITVRGIYYCDETQAGAETRILQVMKENPDISGWAMVGSWALADPKAFPWPPGTIRCVAMGVLPHQLAQVRDHHVDLVIAQPYFQWGYRTVERIVLKAGLDRKPPEPVEFAAIESVTPSNVDAYAKIMESWAPSPNLAK